MPPQRAVWCTVAVLSREDCGGLGTMGHVDPAHKLSLEVLRSSHRLQKGSGSAMGMWRGFRRGRPWGWG